jgi:NAD(P)-dependent dehydrogenase (short-subunit alcohol dehydrogenase family)
LFARIEEAPYEAYRKVLETNLFGYIHSARAVLPYFRKQGSGTLINVSSVVGKPGSPFVSAYTISKFGIVGLSESLRMELQDAPDIPFVPCFRLRLIPRSFSMQQISWAER